MDLQSINSILSSGGHYVYQKENIREYSKVFTIRKYDDKHPLTSAASRSEQESYAHQTFSFNE